MSPLRRYLILGLVIAGMFACSKATESTDPSTAVRTEPPRLLTRGSFPSLSVTESNAAGRPSLRMGVEVMVDSLGRADLRTLKVTGVVDTQNRMAVERWLQGVIFRPAMRNGEAVSGLFKMSLTVRVTPRL
jgi:hypothetical protein